MTPEIVIDLLRQGTSLLLILVSLLILPSLVVGLFISVFQAATQINEQSLSFVPRLIVTFTTLIIAAPWLLRVLTDFTQNLIESIPHLIG
jgi:flagellar biosynthetic protein FliQ